MSRDPDFQNAKSRTYELIGRNVILLQQLEQLLKAILPVANLAGDDGAAIEEKHDKYVEKIEMQTLGNLVKRFSEELLESEESNSSDPVGEPGMAFSLRQVYRSESLREEHIDRLKNLVDSRNQMVHHLLDEITHDDPESWVATHSFLEELGEKVRREIKMLQDLGLTSEKMLQRLKNPEVRNDLINGE